MQKFIGRKKELKEIETIFNSKTSKAICIYGKRRVGKTELVKQSLKNRKEIIIYYECLETTLNINLKNLTEYALNELDIPSLYFSSFQDLFRYLGSLNKKIIIVIDEYPYLKKAANEGYVDSVFQNIIDSLSNNIKIVLLGSYVGVMKELLKDSNPLFGRFNSTICLQPMNYYESQFFYPDLSNKEKADFYSIFGGTPFASAFVDQTKNLKENIINNIVKENAVLRGYLDNSLLKEAGKVANANAILNYLQNGKNRYNDIEMAVGSKSAGSLNSQLKPLIEMGLLEKVAPINVNNDPKKTFYTISDNLVRFYYTYIFRNKGLISRIGEEQFYSLYIEPTLHDFISRRFENTCREYFISLIKNGKLKDVHDIGTFWYNDSKNRKNGEFDCVLKLKNGYTVYEVKHTAKPISSNVINDEIVQLKELSSMCGIDIISNGFISWSGFEKNINTDSILITCDDLYSDVK